ncbi:acyltransferase [Actinokineospora guangxiensis]|uniref:Acyltransferase n=1 Tax=Actinokineospora guangxiensis TaxID=1490288 RepID=A0ABW0EK20_9PSEU
MIALLRTALWLLPPSGLKNRLLRWCGHDVARTARAGICLVDGRSAVRIGEGAVVGHGNAFRGLRRLEVGAGAIVGQLNWWTVAPGLRLDDEHGAVVLGEHAVVTNRHYIDCSGGLALADFATLGGVRCTVLTHSVDLTTGRQTLSPVVLEHQAFISTNCVVMAGTRLAERAVLAAGSVTALGGRYERHTLYGGVPAKPIRPIDGAYFHRTEARIGQ